MGLLDFLFGSNTKKIEDFKKRDAVILDVRTQKEYDAGAISGSKHIPLNDVSSKISEIKQWNKPVITCCASGVRSGNAAKTLNNNSIEAINGGGWKSLEKKL
ncbi:rhodanese-like domain-containing protein [Marixanthomonas ophiurae]|uniref:Rhodanese-like domain-containing protein n=1 Tax=Marixanthomonas ophiurae TaxID=387659 RepID=A0A3E1QC76_9FLAO|nr:rhodanese-like domain-containing protein [Marixanthomonas ophiurae]RFN59728.1 rhodanese-like domain-containing protein [Marixanthomonas ophiurae]